MLASSLSENNDDDDDDDDDDSLVAAADEVGPGAEVDLGERRRAARGHSARPEQAVQLAQVARARHLCARARARTSAGTSSSRGFVFSA